MSDTENNTRATDSVQPEEKIQCVTFDDLVAQSMDHPSGSAAGAAGATMTSHPSIFRKGTLIEIPDVALKSSRRSSGRRNQVVELKQRLVAVCIKEDAHAKRIVNWLLQKELVLERDRVVLIHVRLAANGIIGDLTSTNGAKEDAERAKSHELLRKYATMIKQEGFNIKGVSIRGVDIRGELIRKLFEIKCDLVVIGCHSSKSIRERFTGHKADYLAANSPCPVLVVRDNMKIDMDQELVPEQ
ncbi:hypothetical protein EV177_003451 [Coemansia sp. RSA 1804]|nr:hypothetical protein EV177_003451 [Coemansia sp. RSA 1804]